MKRLILFFITIIMLIMICNNYKENYYIIPNESIRIRIIPNSNNVKDQELKRKVKTNLEIELQSDLKDSKTIETSRKIIQSNINKYDKTIKNVLKNEHSEQKYSINYGYHYFPEKTYKGVKYKEGEYESLLITLGKGEGNNWWCVLFPPICDLEEETSNNTEKTEYKLYIKEIFNKYIR